MATKCKAACGGKNKGDLKAKNRKGKERSTADIVYTPGDLAAECVSLIPVVPGQLWLDPFKGGGAFYDRYPAAVSKDWDEIREGKDFFRRRGESVDWVVSNPPYSEFEKVLQK